MARTGADETLPAPQRSFGLSLPKLALPRRRSAERAAPSASNSSFVIPSLDGLRAISVGLVFAVHAGISGSPGPLGVTIFFFLSGFLITTLLRLEFEKTGNISLRNFYLRRAFRLLPPLYLMLGAAYALTLLGWLGAQKLRLGACLAQVFFLSNYQILHSGWDGPHTGRPVGTGALWSLAVEEHFYLLFPLFYLVLCRTIASRRRQAAILAGICGLVLAWRFVLILGLHRSFDRTYAASDTRIDSILFGCILAIAANPVLDRVKRTNVRVSTVKRLWAPVVAPIAAVALFAAFWMPSEHMKATVQYTIDGLALIPIFIVAIRYHDRGVLRLLNWRPVMFVGAVSYSIYIIHEPLIAFIKDHFAAGQMIHGVAYAVATLFVAWAIYRYVERPFARLRRRLARVTPAKAQTRTEVVTAPATPPEAPAVTAVAALAPSQTSG